MKKILTLLLILNTLLLALPPQKLEKVSLQLKWLDQFQFAGYYMAKEKGFYKDEGLEVEFLKYNPNKNLVSSVISSDATYGIGDSSLIIEKSNGKNITLLSAIFQSSPMVILSNEKSNIKSVDDFNNKRLMASTQEQNNLAILSMISQHGVDIESINILDHTRNLDDFINNKTDLITAYLPNEIFYLDKKNIKYTIHDPKEHGFDFYSDILYTSYNEITKHQDRARSFTLSSLKGWEYAFDNIEETVDIILEKYNTQDISREALLYEAKELKKLAYYKTDNLGSILKNKINRIYDVYNVMGLVKNDINFNTFIIEDFNYMHKELFIKSEKQYIKNKKEIKMCSDPNWMPFEKIVDNQLIGMSADYLKIVEEKVGIPFVLVPTKTWSESIEFAKQKKCDIFSLAMKTPSREKYMNFTTPHAVIPLVIATTKDKLFIADIKDVLDKKFAAAKGYAFTEFLKIKYPNVKIVEVENTLEGIKKVQEKEVYGFIGTLPTVAYLLQRSFSQDLKITGQIEENWKLSLGVQKDDLVLLNILEKATQSIDSNIKHEIIAKWINIKVEKGFDYSLMWKLALFVAILLIFILYRYRLTNIYNMKMNKNLKIIDKYVLISYTDVDGIITEASQALCDTTGYTKEELIGKTHSIFKHPDTDPKIFTKLWNSISSGHEWRGEIKNLSKDGSVYWIDAVISPIFNANGIIEGYTGIRYDITDKKRIEELSVTDQLTKLHNRHYLDKGFKRKVEYANRYNYTFCIIILDIDLFKNVNDTYGHDVGDSVLVEVAKILEDNVRTTDVLGRWGGEEFLIICHETDIHSGVILANKIREKIKAYCFDNVGKITCSFGVSEFKNEDKDKEVIKRADNALYKAKDNGRNCVEFEP